MSRSTQQRISDALEAIERCRRYSASFGSDDPTQVQMAVDAVARNLQIIGDAVKHLPNDVTARHPEVPWPQVCGFRNVLVHRYFAIDAPTIRDIVDNHLDAVAEALLRESDGDASLP